VSESELDGFIQRILEQIVKVKVKVGHRPKKMRLKIAKKLELKDEWKDIKTKEELLKYLNGMTSYMFSIVRHPFDR